MSKVLTSADKFIVLHKYLHFNGDRVNDLSYGQHLWVVSHCDGYGELSIREIMAMDVAYDWSHVRDSSEDAINATYRALLTLIK